MYYFDDITKKKFSELLCRSELVLAHTAEDGRKETLEEHGELCIKYLKKITEKKQLDHIMEGMEKQWLGWASEMGRGLFREMLFHTIYLHDIGKINCNYQRGTLKNKYFRENIDFNNSNHSMLSAIIYINEFYNILSKISSGKERAILSIFLLLNSYIISKHHGNFDGFKAFMGKLTEPDGEGKRLYTEQMLLFEESYLKEILHNNAYGALKKLVKSIGGNIKYWEKERKEISFELFVYTRFIASLLLSCDYYATTEFKNQKEVKEFGAISDIGEFYDIFKQESLYKKIRHYEKNEYGQRKSYESIKDINVLRNELFLDAERYFLESPWENIYYLEAPTGSGKSMVSFNLAFRMLERIDELNKIFYVYPFNTLIEQNLENLSKIFGNSERMKDIAVVNSLVPIITMKKETTNIEHSEEVDQGIDYVRSLLDRQFLHYPIVLTTHVSMFRFLFGTNKEDLFPLAQIANSVIILDEIQSYKNSIWKEIITFLNHYAKLLNIKVIIMSATLPNLSKLIDTEVRAVSLIKDRGKYFKNPIFKDRVRLDFTLLDSKENVMDRLIEHVAMNAKKDNINILMEFIYRKSAEEAYQKLCDLEIGNKEVMILTGESSAHERKEIVKAFKEKKDIILAATQVVEAGVDLDANIGYKDISLLDSEEQFLGRINRHFLKEGEVGQVYFFDLDSAERIYKDDVRKEGIHTLLNKEIRDILLNKEFGAYYEKVLTHLVKSAEGSNGFREFVEKSVGELDFSSIESRMNLIDAQYQNSIFFSRIIKISDTEVLDGEEVWNHYVSLLEDNEMEYAEKRIKLQEASTRLNHFIYETKKKNFDYEKHIGNLYYLSIDVDRYFENGRFVRERFEEGLFL
ncbi:MAG TPA: CRISPR-associated helicase Cas3' [Clostridiales bacterium]|nr:CRISPR-associated helicase Cas3' [Clostridiales bacterium]